MGGIDSAAPQPDRIRLHITPFSADIYDRIIPPSLQPLAIDTSFHTVQTSPERGYGFVELPAMEAQKLKRKLNGSTLKGTKMSVEEARPAKKRKSDAEVDGAESDKKKAKRERKERTTKEEGVLAGHELEEGRRVKRGWTGDDAREKRGKGQKQERKKKTSDGPEEKKLRFKTKVPPNKGPVEEDREKKKKDKKGKESSEKGQVVVEEFTKRRKSRKNDSPLEGATPGSTSHVEGRGWVDEAGNVVEPERKSKRRNRHPMANSEPLPSADENGILAGAGESQSGSVTNEAAEEAEEELQSSAPKDSSSESEAEAPSGSPTPQQPKAVHPLEALFKRPASPTATPTNTSPNTTPSKPRPAPIDTSFSFFGAGGADENVDVDMDEAGPGALPPVTPHTKQDLEWRSLRSAAPTPDTAAIGRKFSFPFAHGGLEEDEDDEDEDAVEHQQMQFSEEAAGMGKGEGRDAGDRGEESAFRRWFFENRGDLNRGWKKRRRDERKVKRQRENRRLGRKVA